MAITSWYEFRDEADRRAAEADFRALTEHLVKKYHGNEEDAAEALCELVMTDPRLQALAVSKYVTYVVETDPLISEASCEKAKGCQRKENCFKKVKSRILCIFLPQPVNDFSADAHAAGVRGFPPVTAHSLVKGCRECEMARICRRSAILVRPHARTLLHDLRVYQLAPKADEHGFGFPRLLALSCRAPMARPSPLWARGSGAEP